MGLALLALAPADAAFAVTKRTTQPTVDTLMYNMLRDGRVAKATKFYKTSVQGAMMYYSCPKEYNVDEAKKRRYEQQLFSDQQVLRKAFDDAHQTLTGKLPGADTVTAINAHIRQLHDKEAVATGKAVQKSGCTDGNFRRLDAYFEKVAAARAQGIEVH